MKTTEDSIIHTGNNQPIGAPTPTQVHEAFHKAADQTQPVLEKLGTGARDGIKMIGDTVDDVSEKLIGRGNEVGAAYQRFAESGRSCVRKCPAMSVLLAIVAGYGLSKLLTTRKE